MRTIAVFIACTFLCAGCMLRQTGASGLSKDVDPVIEQEILYAKRLIEEGKVDEAADLLRMSRPTAASFYRHWKPQLDEALRLNVAGKTAQADEILDQFDKAFRRFQERQERSNKAMDSD